MFWRVLIALFCLTFVLYTPSCIHPHKAPVSQGNLLRDEDIERLNIGMTKEQVVFLIGQPILVQPFAKARWDYVYMSRRGFQEPVRKNLVLIFENDKLIRIKDNYKEKDSPADES